MTLKEIRQKKQELNYSNQDIADHTGISLEKIDQIFAENGSVPDYETMQLLCSFLAPAADHVKEAAPKYGEQLPTNTKFIIDPLRQGHYTLEDYHNLPEDFRAELIDGVLFTMDAPTVRHQNIGGFVYNQMFNFISKKKGSCLPLIAPVDVQLDCDNRTMVQPDVIVLCDRSKNIDRCIYGAPDFVMEVISKSTRKKDMIIKSAKYQNAGVREYWIVDPYKKTVLVYNFQSEDFLTIYGFDDKIPIGIWNGELQIDFKKVQEYCALFL